MLLHLKDKDVISFLTAFLIQGEWAYLHRGEVCRFYCEIIYAETVVAPSRDFWHQY